MRPEILFPLFAPLSKLPGVGPRIEKAMARLTGPHIVDLLFHLPHSVIDRSHRPQLVDARIGEVATLKLRVVEHIVPPNRRTPYRVNCEDETGAIQLVFFHAHKDYLTKTLPIGDTVIASGKIEAYGERPQMVHPDFIVPESQQDTIPTIEPVYGLTAGVTQKVMLKALDAARKEVCDLPEWLHPDWIKRNNWPTWQSAVLDVHSPEAIADFDAMAPARARLAYDELLAHQLALALARETMKRQTGGRLQLHGDLARDIFRALPFKLTGDQVLAINEIKNDLLSSDRMVRMLQGDVGSGKTVVALIAMAFAVEAGVQAAFMAPTEILTRQHYDEIADLAEKVGIKTVLLTGRDKGKGRAERIAAIENGTAEIVIGTHALFQDDVNFKDLGLVVIDEQHRFGVHQRLALTEKGVLRANILTMTATPIPRTLTMTFYGDMDVSFLKEKPPGRQPIKTSVLPSDRLEQVYQAIGRAMDADNQVYWVCPLVEESDQLDLAAAEERWRDLSARFGDKVGLIHGRMKAAEKDSVMERFVAGEIRGLVATTVIEVGVNVPSATIMIIEHAERFGLAQLHQLRGRVGRGDKASTCLLIYSAPLSETAKARLAIMRETEDGFVIAEEDLRLRGPGDVLGVKQSGLPDFKLADLKLHASLLNAARDDSKLILNADPGLTSSRGKAVRVLLYLFEKDDAIHYIRS